jgi:hypothetical protein
MKRKFFIAAIYVLKFTILFLLLKFGMDNYKSELSFYNQKFTVWVFVYFPGLMGFESIISIFKPKK